MEHHEPPSLAADDGPPPASSRRRVWPWFVGFAVLAALALVIVADRRSAGPDTLSPQEIDKTVKAAVDKGLEEARSAPPDAAVVYQAILPSLVLISTERDRTASGDTGVGTGVVVNEQGAILTARHVIAGARTIEVTFSDGTKASAQIVSEEPENDIAVIQADQPPEVIVPAVLGGGVHEGDAAFAVGHPLGLVGSLTAGVISGLDRAVPLPDGSTLKGLIQFDAAVNPGSSGGPLLNRAGQVVGIVTALANPSQQGFFIGIGFAVPIGTAGGAAGAPAQ
jgi:S1-C subfamily serine protease